jgi:hypothetical protein
MTDEEVESPMIFHPINVRHRANLSVLIFFQGNDNFLGSQQYDNKQWKG